MNTEYKIPLDHSSFGSWSAKLDLIWNSHLVIKTSLSYSLYFHLQCRAAQNITSGCAVLERAYMIPPTFPSAFIHFYGGQCHNKNLCVLGCGFLMVFQSSLDSDTYKWNLIYIQVKILLLSPLFMLMKICLWWLVSYPQKSHTDFRRRTWEVRYLQSSCRGFWKRSPHFYFMQYWHLSDVVEKSFNNKTHWSVKLLGEAVRLYKVVSITQNLDGECKFLCFLEGNFLFLEDQLHIFYEP